MKEFDLNAAKEGAPVQTRNGLAARIISFDAKDPVKPIVALVQSPKSKNKEDIMQYAVNGKSDQCDHQFDLVMAAQHHEGYILIYDDPSTKNIYKEPRPHVAENGFIFKTKMDAEKDNPTGMPIVKIEWED